MDNLQHITQDLGFQTWARAFILANDRLDIEAMETLYYQRWYELTLAKQPGSRLQLQIGFIIHPSTKRGEPA